MKYYEVDFSVNPVSSDACDLLAAMAGETGFETFEETAQGLKGYVQQQLFDQCALDTALQSFPLPGISITYTVAEAEDRDWNEQWEQEGFEPILVEGGGWKVKDGEWKEEGDLRPSILIHDGRHFPPSTIRSALPLCPVKDLPPSTITVEIDAHLAFGTGTHETTRMVCSFLLEIVPARHPSMMLDCGTGTGILSICALKLGVHKSVGYDIDEWSVENARHNAVINGVDDRFQSLHGDASILNKVEGAFDIVVANINRNILLVDLPLFRQKMNPGGCIILSGFYTEDVPLLIDKANELGLSLVKQKEENGWACIELCQTAD